MQSIQNHPSPPFSQKEGKVLPKSSRATGYFEQESKPEKLGDQNDSTKQRMYKQGSRHLAERNGIDETKEKPKKNKI